MAVQGCKQTQFGRIVNADGIVAAAEGDLLFVGAETDAAYRVVGNLEGINVTEILQRPNRYAPVLAGHVNEWFPDRGPDVEYRMTMQGKHLQGLFCFQIQHTYLPATLAYEQKRARGRPVERVHRGVYFGKHLFVFHPAKIPFHNAGIISARKEIMGFESAFNRKYGIPVARKYCFIFNFHRARVPGGGQTPDSWLYLCLLRKCSPSSARLIFFSRRSTSRWKTRSADSSSRSSWDWARAAITVSVASSPTFCAILVRPFPRSLLT